MLSRFSPVRLCVTQWTVARQAPLSVGFPRQEYWSGLPLEICRGSPRPRDQTWISYVSCIGRPVLYLQWNSFLSRGWCSFPGLSVQVVAETQRERKQRGGGEQRFGPTLMALCETGSPNCFARLLWGREWFSHVLHRVTLKCRRPPFVLPSFLLLSSRSGALASPLAACGASSPGAFSLLIHVLGDVTLVLATRGALCFL